MTIAHDTGIVGDLGSSRNKRIPIAIPDNPMDRCTVVSVYPRRIVEQKHTIQPGRFILEAGTVEKPSVLEVKSSSYYKDVDPDQELLEMSNYSIQVAESIVRDWAVGLFCCNMGDTMPGLFYVLGKKSTHQVLKEADAEGNFLVNIANEKQNRWYVELVKAADHLWARTNGSPNAIGEHMKLAAMELNLTNKAWLADARVMNLTRCISCGELRDADFPVCKHCHAVVDRKKFEEMKLSFAS